MKKKQFYEAPVAETIGIVPERTIATSPTPGAPGGPDGYNDIDDDY